MLKKLFTKSVSVLTAFAVTLTFIPNTLQAQNGPMYGNAGAAASVTSASTSSEESVVASSEDTPLVRYAKMKRAWVVYREIDASEIYAITTDMEKREIQTLDFFTAFNTNYHVKIVKQGRLEGLETGDPITSADGLDPEDFRKAPWRCRLVKSEDDPAVYLVCGSKRRVIIREGVFHRYGWEFRDVETVTEDEINALEEDTTLDESTVFEEDVEIDTTVKRQLRERLTERLQLQNRTQVRDRIVKAENSADVYVISPDGTRRHIESMEAANQLNLNLRNLAEVSEDELEAFEEGEPITTDSATTDLDVVVE